MKRLLRSVLLVLAFSAALVTSAFSTVAPDPVKTGISQIRDLGTFAFASLPTASTTNQNKTAFATDLGASGTLVASTGSRWRPVAGDVTLKNLGAAASGIANTETVALQALIPTNAWQANDTVRIYVSLTKSGTTDSLNLAVRVGTAGTTGDTAVLSSVAFLAAASQTAGFMLEFKLASATSVQRVGTQGVQTAYNGGNATAAASPVTISDASANPLYVTVTIASSGATNTVGIQSGQIQLVTP